MKKTVLFIYQTGKKKKDSGEIIYGFKSIILEHKIEMKCSIYKMAKWLDNFFCFSLSEMKELIVSGVVINTRIVLLLSYLSRGIMGK